MSNSLDYIRPANEAERLYLESLIREDYERCHPGKMLEDIKRRSRFSKEDKGLLRDWMELAGIRAATRAKPQHDRDRTNAIAVAALSRRRRNAHVPANPAAKPRLWKESAAISIRSSAPTFQRSDSPILLQPGRQEIRQHG